MRFRDIALVFAILGLVLYTGASANTYGNYTKVTAYATNIFGWHMSWVTSKWTFATYSDGSFIRDPNTFETHWGGGHLGDYGSWDYAHEWEANKELVFWGHFTLHGIPGNSISGILYNKVVRTSGGHHMWYYGVNYLASQEISIPVEIAIEIEA